MKTISMFVLYFVLQLAPGISGAVPILDAIELVGKVLSSSATSGASASVNFTPVVGQEAVSFSGSANTSAATHVTGFSSASAQSTASWSFQFKSLQPEMRYLIDWSFSDSASASSSRFADASAEARVNASSLLNTIADIQSVSVDTVVGSESDSKANAAGGTINLGYLSVGSLFDFTGTLFSKAVSDSGFLSSASSNANSNLNFTIRAIPEPSTVASIGLGLAIMVAISSRRRRPSITA